MAINSSESIVADKNSYGKVSVGIPTFNRPQGLYRTLQSITQQTYKNLEIIVSDNATEGSEVEKIAQEFIAKDPRVRFFKQPKNLGPTPNFQFLLKKATGDFFMWAADDDQWDHNFIEVCVKHSISGSSVMTGFKTHYRKLEVYEDNKIPFLNSQLSPRLNLKNYFKNMQPSLFYGLHKREAIQFFLEEESFDFYDCYFVIKLILTMGFDTLPQYSCYSVGIDGDGYEFKTFKPTKYTRFNYLSFFKSVRPLISQSKRLNRWEKMDLYFAFIRVLFSHFKHLEFSNQAKPRKEIIILKNVIRFSRNIFKLLRRYFYRA